MKTLEKHGAVASRMPESLSFSKVCPRVLAAGFRSSSEAWRLGDRSVRWKRLCTMKAREGGKKHLGKNYPGGAYSQQTANLSSKTHQWSHPWVGHQSLLPSFTCITRSLETIFMALCQLESSGRTMGLLCDLQFLLTFLGRENVLPHLDKTCHCLTWEEIHLKYFLSAPRQWFSMLNSFSLMWELTDSLWCCNNGEVSGNDVKMASKELQCMPFPTLYSQWQHAILWHHLDLNVRTEVGDKVVRGCWPVMVMKSWWLLLFCGRRGAHHRDKQRNVVMDTMWQTMHIFFLVHHLFPPSFDSNTCPCIETTLSLQWTWYSSADSRDDKW